MTPNEYTRWYLNLDSTLKKDTKQLKNVRNDSDNLDGTHLSNNSLKRP